MRTIVVLAAHGALPSDFPKDELAEFFELDARLHAGAAGREVAARRHAELGAKLRAWPRTPGSDAFWAASRELGARLADATGREVIVAFNEFCAPSVDDALDEAVGRGAGEVVVVTPMMTRGGQHAERDIPAAIESARRRHAHVTFRYAWPFDTGAAATFLARQLDLADEPVSLRPQLFSRIER